MRLWKWTISQNSLWKETIEVKQCGLIALKNPDVNVDLSSYNILHCSCPNIFFIVCLIHITWQAKNFMILTKFPSIPTCQTSTRKTTQAILKVHSPFHFIEQYGILSLIQWEDRVIYQVKCDSTLQLNPKWKQEGLSPRYLRELIHLVHYEPNLLVCQF